MKVIRRDICKTYDIKKDYLAGGYVGYLTTIICPIKTVKTEKAQISK
jgi:hypothetical protein